VHTLGGGTTVDQALKTFTQGKGLKDTVGKLWMAVKVFAEEVFQGAVRNLLR